MDKNLQKVKKAVFSSGSFNQSIEMAAQEFNKLEQPIIGAFSELKKFKKPLKKALKKTVKKVKRIVKKSKKITKKRR
jgi:hypothetical protein